MNDYERFTRVFRGLARSLVVCGLFVVTASLPSVVRQGIIDGTAEWWQVVVLLGAILLFAAIVTVFSWEAGSSVADTGERT